MNTRKIIERMNLSKELNVTSDNDVSGTQDQISNLCHCAVYLDGSSANLLSMLTTQSYDNNILQAFIVNRDGTIDNFCYCQLPPEIVESDTNVHLVSSPIDEFVEEYHQHSPYKNNPYLLAYETKEGNYRFLPASKM